MSEGFGNNPGDGRGGSALLLRGLSRPLGGLPRLTRRRCGVTVDLVYHHKPQTLEPTGQSAGIDLGARKRLTLSNDEKVEPETTDWKQVRRLQRAVARCKRGSRRRAKQRTGRRLSRKYSLVSQACECPRTQH